MTTHVSDRPSGFLNSLVGAWTRYRRRRAAISELRALGNPELDRIVKDAGLTFGDLLSLAKQNGDSAALLYRRLEAAGINFKTVEPAVLRDMQRCCSLCDSKPLCAHELEDKPKAANWPEYCPNQQTIEALGSARCH